MFNLSRDVFPPPLKRHPRKARKYSDQASDAYDNENYPAAIDAAKKALAINPHSKDAYNILGLAYSRTGQHKEAIVNFTGAIAILKDPVFFYNRALSHFDLKDDEHIHQAWLDLFQSMVYSQPSSSDREDAIDYLDNLGITLEAQIKYWFDVCEKELEIETTPPEKFTVNALKNTIFTIKTKEIKLPPTASVPYSGDKSLTTKMATVNPCPFLKSIININKTELVTLPSLKQALLLQAINFFDLAHFGNNVNSPVLQVACLTIAKIIFNAIDRKNDGNECIKEILSLSKSFDNHQYKRADTLIHSLWEIRISPILPAADSKKLQPHLQMS